MNNHNEQVMGYRENKMVIDSFSDEYRFLSNFYLHPVKYVGLIFPSNEHAFQAIKSLDETLRIPFQIQDVLPIIKIGGKLEQMKQMTCAQAKRTGRDLTLRVDWEEIKIIVMTDLCRIKFSDPHLRSLLLATGDAELIEGNWWHDQFWGVCNGVGQNQLGKILMAIRNLYRNL